MRTLRDISRYAPIALFVLVVACAGTDKASPPSARSHKSETVASLSRWLSGGPIRAAVTMDLSGVLSSYSRVPGGRVRVTYDFADEGSRMLFGHRPTDVQLRIR